MSYEDIIEAQNKRDVEILPRREGVAIPPGELERNALALIIYKTLKVKYGVEALESSVRLLVFDI
jgi:hypothetical protein